MKKITILLIILLSTQLYSQNKNLTPFVGTWIWQDGNETFTVELYVEDNSIKGHYKLEENNNGVLTTIYNSNRLLNQEHNFYYGYAIYGFSKNGDLLYGHVDDNVLYGPGYDTKIGNLAFTIVNDGFDGQPMTATWVIRPNIGMKSTNEPDNFNIPTNITLTKTN